MAESERKYKTVMKGKLVSYRATLLIGDALRFMANFHELELAVGVTLMDELGEDIRSRVITLIPQDESSAELLESSFSEGILHHAGWDQKFKPLVV